MKKITVVWIILLFLGSSVPAFAKPQSSLPNMISSNSASSDENCTVYIGAGFFRQYGDWKFGLGWHMTVIDTGDVNVTGFFL